MKNKYQMMKDDVSQLTQLGTSGTKHQYSSPSADLLETFPNQYPKRDYTTEFVFTEFTSVCPKTGQPDFATIKIEYVSREKCIETKSLKTYFLAYRNEPTFMETLTNRILEDCVKVAQPKWMRVTAQFNSRGGTFINVIAEQ